MTETTFRQFVFALCEADKQYKGVVWKPQKIISKTI